MINKDIPRLKFEAYRMFSPHSFTYAMLATK